MDTRFENIDLETLGLLPIKSKENHYIMGIMDFLTKWSETIPITGHDASTVAEVLI